MNELNETAWDQWKAYRSAIKKPIKPVSEDAMKLKLSRMGDAETQQKIVDQSISNQWQGLFELKAPAKQPFDPHAPKTRTVEQQKAADAVFEHAVRENEKTWRELSAQNVLIGELMLAEALMSRYDLQREDVFYEERVRRLRDSVADRLRQADAAEVLKNLTILRLVRRLFNEAGVIRLENRAKGI